MIFDCALPKPPWSCGRISATQELLERVSQLARSQLGADTEVEADAELGGVVGRAGSTVRRLHASRPRRARDCRARRAAREALAMTAGRVRRVNGPVLEVVGLRTGMLDLVEVGGRKLPGEVIALDPEAATVQVYAYTGGVRPGDEVVTTGQPLMAELGPGLLGGVYDGMLRRLSGAEQMLGSDQRAATLDQGEALALPARARTPDSRWSPETCSGTCRRVPRSPFAHSCLTGSAVRSNGSLPRPNSTSRSRSHVFRESRSRSRTTGLCGVRGRPGNGCGQTPRSSLDSGRSTSSSRSPEGGARRFPGGSGPARPSCSNRSPSGVTRM